MKIRCKIELNYNDKRSAEIIYKSIKMDDEDFVKSYLCDKKIIAEIESPSIGSLLHTLNDYLACISVAEEVLDKD